MYQELPSRHAQPPKTYAKHELYVHVCLNSVDSMEVLSQEDVAQAAQNALIARVNEHRCKVWAIHSGCSHLEAVIQIPPSLPISVLWKIAQEASGKSVAWHLHLHGDELRDWSIIWSRQMCIKTISLSEAQAVTVNMRGKAGCYANGNLLSD